MRNIIWFFALILLLVLQNGILVPLHIISVNLVLIVVAIATLLSEFNQGLIITLMGGLITDFMSGLPDGVMTISFLLAFLILHFILNEILAREAIHIRRCGFGFDIGLFFLCNLCQLYFFLV